MVVILFKYHNYDNLSFICLNFQLISRPALEQSVTFASDIETMIFRKGNLRFLLFGNNVKEALTSTNALLASTVKILYRSYSA